MLTLQFYNVHLSTDLKYINQVYTVHFIWHKPVEISVTREQENHLSIMLVAIGNSVSVLHKLFSLVNHHPAKGCDTLRDLQTRQLAHLGSCEAIHRVGTDLECQLSAIQHTTSEWVCLLLQVRLSSVDSKHQLSHHWSHTH